MMPPVKLRCATALAVTIIAAALPARGQEQPMPSAGAVKVALERLGTTARVLYVAAHPDDENTRLLAYLANGRHLDVAYLSLTRGGGGQNLIGPEQAELLAAIRTQELLAARRIDGARQFFTRARDFGYSKTPVEALAKWGQDTVLHDVVWVIRTFRPDVIINRFTEKGPSHGHHTASAQLARLAFDAAADATQFPEQLTNGVTPWSPHRLVLNVPRWRNSNDDVSGYLALDVGEYDPRLGAGYAQIAARSRTMHKSQGFGSSGRRGPVMEYFDHVAGPKAKADILEGVALGWDRFDGGQDVQTALAQAKAAFSVEAPERLVPDLLRARTALVKLARKTASPRIVERVKDIDALVTQALGMFVRATASRAEVTAGDQLEVELTVILDRPGTVHLVDANWPGAADAVPVKPPARHEPVVQKRTITVPADAPPTVAHWLRGPLSTNVYPVDDPTAVARPEDRPPLVIGLTFAHRLGEWEVEVPIERTWTDRIHGERRRPVMIVPPLAVNPLTAIALFPQGAPRTIEVRVRAGRDGARGAVGLGLPKMWTATPAEREVSLAKAGDEATVSFKVTPPGDDAPPVTIQPYVTTAGERSSLRYDVIDYPHLPVQGVLRSAQIRLVPLAFTPPRGRIGYVPGSGDTVAEHLRTAGVHVETIDGAALRSGSLAGFDTILVGVRAYNTREDDFRQAYPGLMKFVKAGGRLIIQYNTNNRWKKLTIPVGPYPFEIGKGRVTDETAIMKVLKPEHALFRRPHAIGKADFDGWVQERGLYFAGKWSDEYVPLLKANDKGEAPLSGSLIVAKHGKGSFIYTGLSFFRQLPAGVPGAYRLLANLLHNESVQ